MGKKILVTGGAGFMGSHLADYLLEKGHEVYSVDDLSGGYLENVHEDAKFTKLDLRNKEKTAQYIKETKPEIIYHLAADATEGRSQFTPIECTERNYNAFLNLIIPAIKKGFEKIVVTSSMAVYGNQQAPFSENVEPKPEDIYGISKYAMEKALQVLSKVHGFRYTILRPHNVYGPRQNMADPYRNVIAIFINCLLRNKPFYIYGDGEQKRSFSYIDDINPCMARAGLEKKSNGEIINVGPAKECTINQLSQTVLKLMDKQHMNPIFLPLRPQEVKNAWCTHDKCVNLLSFEQKHILEQGIKKMIDWAKSVGPKEPVYLEDLELKAPNTPRTWTEKLI